MTDETHEDLSEYPPPSVETAAAVVVDRAEPAGKPPVPRLVMDWELKRRRLTVFFRPILMFPHYFVQYAYGVAAGVLTIGIWFYALVKGRPPVGPTTFVSKVAQYQARTMAYSFLLTDTYPPFSLTDPADPALRHPVGVEIYPGPLNRGAVFFRMVLLFPSAMVSVFLQMGVALLSIAHWLFAMVRGRSPQPIYQVTAVYGRYAMRQSAYMNMISPRYPVGPFGDKAAEAEAPTSADDVPFSAGPVDAALDAASTGSALTDVIDTEGVSASPEPAPFKPARNLFVLSGGARTGLIATSVVGIAAYIAIIAVAVSAGINEVTTRQTVIDDANAIIQSSLAAYNTTAEGCAQDQATYDDCIKSAASLMADAFDSMSDDISDAGGSRSIRNDLSDATKALEQIFRDISNASSTEEIATLEGSTEAAFKTWGAAMDEFVNQ